MGLCLVLGCGFLRFIHFFHSDVIALVKVAHSKRFERFWGYLIHGILTENTSISSSSQLDIFGYRVMGENPRMVLKAGVTVFKQNFGQILRLQLHRGFQIEQHRLILLLQYNIAKIE